MRAGRKHVSRFIHSAFSITGLVWAQRFNTVSQKEFVMKRLNKVLLTASLALTCLPAWAGHKESGYDYAKVVAATPVYETVRYPVDEQVCWEEQAWIQQPHSVAPIVLGAIVGGVVGHQFGGGQGKTALTVAGAAVGGTIGYKVAQNHSPGAPYPVAQTRCEIQRNWRTEERISAWDVTYKYRGGIYYTRMLEEPGRKIRVRVQVEPAPY
jgi:uncharacterized protein YcfJ